MKKCIECGCEYDKTAGRQNPYWCPSCDEKRIDRIEKQLEEILEDLKRQKEEYDTGSNI